MLEPLKQFICDSCGEVINSPEEGWIEWLEVYTDDGGRCSKFRICHQKGYSPYKSPLGCYNYTDHPDRADMHLHHFLEEEAIINERLSEVVDNPSARFLGIRVVDVKEYAELLRRIKMPHFEEARLYFQKAKADHFFAPDDREYMFDKNKLKLLIEEYNVWL